MGKKSRNLLHRYIHRARPSNRNGQYVFVSKRGESLTPEGIDKLLERLRERAHIEGVGVSAHTFWHTFAWWYMEAGGDLLRLSRALRHTSLAVTSEYLKAFSRRDALPGHISPLDNL